MRVNKYGSGASIIVPVLALVILGVAIKLMWNWFIAPLSNTNITFLHGIGLALFVFLFMDSSNQELDENLWELFFYDVSRMGSLVLTGWGVKAIMLLGD